ncbi:hypothetical protein VXN68_15420 [Acinetobacter schindleri]|uniref:hypothetical protein n=1 Tax=Acinetobacter schindleri TaxID=108981 RepID=UPI003A84D585
MKKLFLCFLILISCTTYAVDPIDFGTATPSEIRSYNLKRQQEYIEKTDKSFADLGKKIDQVKASYNAPHIKQTLEKSGILSDGSKVQIKTVVTKPADKAKVAQVLTERLKNAKDYAKNVGKASIPTFVGMAAFHGLVEGIGWVMDEGGKITRLPTDEEIDINSLEKVWVTNFQFTTMASTPEASCELAYSIYARPGSNNQYKTFNEDNGDYYCPSTQAGINSRGFNVTQRPNPNYNPSAPQPEPKEIDSSELQIALQQALLNNNAMQAAMIAQAIKDAYSYDGSEGQKPSSNTLVKEAADDMADALPKAFDNPVPTSNPERPSGYYKLTDGDKTVEGYVTPAPVGGTTDTTTTPTIDPVTGQPTGGSSTSGGFELPPFCSWAAIVCDFIDWVREEPEIDEPEVPFKDIDRQEIRDDLLTIGGTACPADIHANFTGLPFGISINKTVEMRPYCDVLEPLKYVFSLLTICLCAFMFLRL